MTKEETLPDRQKFGLNAEQWSAFQKSLDAPPQPSPRLDKLYRSRAYPSAAAGSEVAFRSANRRFPMAGHAFSAITPLAIWAG